MSASRPDSSFLRVMLSFVDCALRARVSGRRWISVDLVGSRWISMDLDGSRWISMVLDGLSAGLSTLKSGFTSPTPGYTVLHRAARG